MTELPPIKQATDIEVTELISFLKTNPRCRVELLLNCTSDDTKQLEVLINEIASLLNPSQDDDKDSYFELLVDRAVETISSLALTEVTFAIGYQNYTLDLLGDITQCE